MPDKDGQHGVDETLDSSVADPGLDAAQPVEPGGAEPLPKQIGRFRVRGRLGSGGMGDVFDAFDPHLSRQVAVKRIRAGAASTVARARFWREARALAQVHDPGVVQVHDIGEDADGSLYIAMQRVDGHALAERLTDAPWPWADVAPFARELARVLAAVHAAGLVHRDLKPG
ncbi:MAG: protein kinase, partial [Myxococcales bacterium]|nr:protein kinase [Myxococcales bacterium]